MKRICLQFVLTIALMYPSHAQTMSIIFDSDMESDVDDVGALAMLHGLADRGDVKILATISSSLNPWSAPMLDVINTYYGRPDIPIGNVKTFGVYRNSKFARKISEKYPQDTGLGEYVQDAVTLYRKLLSEQEDASVVIVTVGYLTNIANLLHSGPDECSSLNGNDLIKKKVRRIVCMGGAYPYHTDPRRYGNFKPDPDAAVDVARNCPVQIIFTAGQAFANAIRTGGILFRSAQNDNPVKESYKIFLESWNREYHHSADLIAVYVAVRGYEEYFKAQKKGYYHIFEDGTNLWRETPDNPNHMIIGEFADGVDPDQVAEAFDMLLLKK
ncbi:MAG: nucleoside hydrolase [Bacteroidales bacterium]|nr:nucleoside hydrolase [Bacteroidales bacterium]